MSRCHSIVAHLLMAHLSEDFLHRFCAVEYLSTTVAINLIMRFVQPYVKYHIQQPGGVGVLTRGVWNKPFDYAVPSPLLLPQKFCLLCSCVLPGSFASLFSFSPFLLLFPVCSLMLPCS